MKDRISLNKADILYKQMKERFLLKENMDLTDEYADTGMLLNYFYGNR